MDNDELVEEIATRLAVGKSQRACPRCGRKFRSATGEFVVNCGSEVRVSETIELIKGCKVKIPKPQTPKWRTKGGPLALFWCDR